VNHLFLPDPDNPMNFLIFYGPLISRTLISGASIIKKWVYIRLNTVLSPIKKTACAIKSDKTEVGNQTCNHQKEFVSESTSFFF
jgi:hypothetical protein